MQYTQLAHPIKLSSPPLAELLRTLIALPTGGCNIVSESIRSTSLAFVVAAKFTAEMLFISELLETRDIEIVWSRGECCEVTIITVSAGNMPLYRSDIRMNVSYIKA